MRRRARHRALVATVLLTACGPPVPEDLAGLLLSAPGLRRIAREPKKHRLQIVVGRIGPESGGTLVLRQETFRAGEEYFYPASTVKVFAAVAALERLAELRAETGLAIDRDTPMVLHPLFPGEEVARADESNLDNGSITVGHEIRKLFLVSDNEAFNRLYELVGQDRLAASLERAGLGTVRIVHRLSEARTPEENRRFPSIDFSTAEAVWSLPERRSAALAPMPEIAGLEVGEAYLAGGEKHAGPMDFRPKNYAPLVDLQRGLCMIVRPDVDCGGPGWSLAPEDRDFLLNAMRQRPRDSSNPIYDPQAFPDDHVKFVLPGLQRVATNGVDVYNKIGMAYGFTTENAYIVDRATGRAFFLAATLYTNEDGVLNDDRYEYDEVALPFLADLGEAVARWMWRK